MTNSPVQGVLSEVLSEALSETPKPLRTSQTCCAKMILTAQCEIPPGPPYRAIPFRDSIAEGGIAPICLVFIGYCANIAEMPLLRGGGIAPPLRMLSKGETLRKGGGGIAPNLPC